MNCYEVLGIEETYEIKRIKKAYAARSREWHPEDHPEEFQVLHAAYEEALGRARWMKANTQESTGGNSTSGEGRAEEVLESNRAAGCFGGTEEVTGASGASESFDGAEEVTGMPGAPGSFDGEEEVREASSAAGEPAREANRFGAGSQTETGSRAETGSEAERSARVETGSEAGTSARVETRFEAERSSWVETSSEAERSARVETGFEAGTSARVETGSEAEAGSEAETGCEAARNCEAELDSEAEMGSEAENFCGQWREQFERIAEDGGRNAGINWMVRRLMEEFHVLYMNEAARSKLYKWRDYFDEPFDPPQMAEVFASREFVEAWYHFLGSHHIFTTQIWQYFASVDGYRFNSEQYGIPRFPYHLYIEQVQSLERAIGWEQEEEANWQDRAAEESSARNQQDSARRSGGNNPSIYGANGWTGQNQQDSQSAQSTGTNDAAWPNTGWQSSGPQSGGARDDDYYHGRANAGEQEQANRGRQSSQNWQGQTNRGPQSSQNWQGQANGGPQSSPGWQGQETKKKNRKKLSRPVKILLYLAAMVAATVGSTLLGVIVGLIFG